MNKGECRIHDTGVSSLIDPTFCSLNPLCNHEAHEEKAKNGVHEEKNQASVLFSLLRVLGVLPFVLFVVPSFAVDYRLSTAGLHLGFIFYPGAPSFYLDTSGVAYYTDRCKKREKPDELQRSEFASRWLFFSLGNAGNR